jgi:hypothetical protein
VQADQASDSATNRQALAQALQRVVQLASSQLDRFRALQPPASDRVVVSKYLAAVASQIALVQQFASAVQDDDSQQVRALSPQISQGKATAQGLAQGYGFTVCGSGP